MTCAKCGHQFCWLCKGDWSQHGSQTGGYYVCNKYNEQNSQGKQSDEEKDMVNNQKLLQKFEYYFKRFKGSTEAIKITQKMNETFEHAAAKHNIDLTKYAFVTEAIDKLIDARRVLSWTYAMAFYLKSGPKKILFEYQQEMLVGNTEALTHIMESNVDNFEKIMSLRSDIMNRTRTIDKFRAEMVAQVERGDFEELLLSKAEVTGNLSVWCCTVCKADNKKEADVCQSCTACQKHGEQECKACKPNSRGY